jgi:hypothetical protein
MSQRPFIDPIAIIYNFFDLMLDFFLADGAVRVGGILSF